MILKKVNFLVVVFILANACITQAPNRNHPKYSQFPDLGNEIEQDQKNSQTIQNTNNNSSNTILNPDIDSILENKAGHHIGAHENEQCRNKWRNSDLKVKMPKSFHIQEVLEYSKEFLGVGYKYGGTGKTLDCSGFVNRVFSEFGYDLPRSSQEMAKVGLKISNVTELEPGHLIFFKTSKKKRISHVGIYLGNNEMIHASSGRKKVLIDKISGYWSKKFVVGSNIFIMPQGSYSNRAGEAREGFYFKKLKKLEKYFNNNPAPCL